jgi:hypothetical protein|tara:strand:- start:139 stop:333 length:195 start_codon:yes stop_codon:yes gene_type:complete
MSDEMYMIQWLGNSPYLVYQTSEFDDCIVVELTQAQQMAVEEFESRQGVEAKAFAKSLLTSSNQ